MMSNALIVRLGQRIVGRITRLDGDRSIFTFDDEYLDDPTRPVLSLGFAGGGGSIYYEPLPTQTKLHPFFSNLLPEGRLRAYLAERGGINPEREYPLLALVGDDLPGAVIVHATDDDYGQPAADTDTSASSVSDADRNGPLKFSLAGVQMKMSAIQNDRGGLTIPATGRGGSWIIKLPSETYEYVPENEAAMMGFAQAIELDVPKFQLVPVAKINGLPDAMRRDRIAYAVQRFDRSAGGRIHMEDFAQIFREYPAEKYGKISYRNIAEVIWQSVGEAGLREFIARLVFNAAIGNGDMHAKNWSLIYPDGRTPALSPAYDFLSTLLYVSGVETMALSLMGTKNFADLDEALLRRLADKGRLPAEIVRRTARETAERIGDLWPEAQRGMELPKRFIVAITKHMRIIPLLNR
jgi:serine/threonine-protein kinase HipA